MLTLKNRVGNLALFLGAKTIDSTLYSLYTIVHKLGFTDPVLAESLDLEDNIATTSFVHGS